MDFIKTREEWKRNDDNRDKDNVISPLQKIIKDIKYSNKDEYYNLCDINYPLETKNSYPVIINVHGGGFFYGTKETYRFYCAHLALSGFAVINFNYRLAPESKFPAPLEDLNALINFLLLHKEEYQLDLNNLFLVGDSAGAQIASNYIILHNSSEYQKLLNIQTPSVKIKAVCLNCGLFDLKKFSKDREFYFEKEDLVTNKIDPLKFINEKFSPVFLLSASHDFLKDEQKPFKDLLDSLKVYNKLEIYEKDIPLYHVFHCDLKNEYGREANKEECNFFKSFIY